MCCSSTWAKTPWIRPRMYNNFMDSRSLKRPQKVCSKITAHTKHLGSFQKKRKNKSKNGQSDYRQSRIWATKRAGKTETRRMWENGAKEQHIIASHASATRLWRERTLLWNLSKKNFFTNKMFTFVPVFLPTRAERWMRGVGAWRMLGSSVNLPFLCFSSYLSLFSRLFII